MRASLIIFERSESLGEVTQDRKKENITPIFKKGKKEDTDTYSLVNLTTVPGKVLEELILETTSGHMKDKNVIRSEHEFVKVKST